MNSALKTDEEKVEHFDTEEELDKKITQLAEMIKKAKHFIAFTGAGISTGAGVKDFRSGINTILPTGPGAWEKLATNDTSKPKIAVSTLQAVPTPSHMSLVKLQEEGFLKFLISQNTDGLHRRSGFPPGRLAELHGNSNLEKCWKPSCQKEYFRDFRVRKAVGSKEHDTGRFCECGGPLYDSIINFGENLPEKPLKDGFDESYKADLCLVLGSSLRVTPAADMPKQLLKRKKNLVIVNLQATPLDEGALRINGMIDKVMIKLMEKLAIAIPKFVLKRRVAVKYVEEDVDGQKKKGISFQGQDLNGTPYSLFTEAKVEFPDSQEVLNISERLERFNLFPGKTVMVGKGLAKANFTLRGHYGEPELKLEMPFDAISMEKDLVFSADYDPTTGIWTTKQL
jgi:NAD-dependent SIR2 family protein deacetylase